MVCRKVLKGLVVGGLVGIAVVQYLRRRGQLVLDEAVSELRPVPGEQPEAPPVESMPDTADEGPQVVETETVEQEPVGRDEIDDDVRTAVIDIDEVSAEELIEPDDLRIIEGIGPKISDILNENGIYTYAQLAGTNVDHLHSILADAGSRFRLADPTTWPQQALAADGD